MLIRKCGPDDLDDLREIAIKTFQETFASRNTEATMAAYLSQAFSREKLLGELSNPDSSFYFLHVAGRPAGYLKLNKGEAQTDLQDPASLEIERIYVAEEFQDTGAGRTLLQKAEDVARESGKEALWLGVWEQNDKAIRFYARNGFGKIGVHSFWVGDEEQTDHIMKKEL